MLRAFLLSIGQLGDPPVLRVFAKSVAATMLVFAALAGLVWWGARALLIGWAGADGLAAAVAVVVTGLALWLLFRAVAIAAVGVFADEVVAAVEARHYPAALSTGRPVPIIRSVGMGVRSAARVVLVNAAMLPVYLVLLATGVGTVAVFFVVNGWLLGRDLGDMVAARHCTRGEAIAWRHRSRSGLFLLGLGETALFVVPVVNLAAPVLGAAMATHLFHRSRA